MLEYGTVDTAITLSLLFVVGAVIYGLWTKAWDKEPER